MRYVCVYLEPGDVLLFWSLNPPKQGPLFQSKQGARFAFQVCISKYIQTSICCLRYAKKGEMCCHCIPFSPIAIVDLQIYHTFCNHASKHSNMPPSTNPGPSTGYIYIYTYVVPWSISSDFIFPTIKNIPTQNTLYTNNRGFQATKRRGANTGYSFPWHHLSSSSGSPVPLTRQGTTSRTGGGPLISSDSSWPEKCGKFEKAQLIWLVHKGSL